MIESLRTATSRYALLGALLCAVATPGLAQKSTEMFIPIGQSAGLSGKHTMQGAVQSVNPAQRTLTVKHEGQVYTAKLGARTPVWLDRSKQQQPNRAGTLADVSPGALVELKFQKNNRTSGDAEWVKVQSTQ